MVQNAKARKVAKCPYITNDACKAIQNNSAAEALSPPTGITFSYRPAHQPLARKREILTRPKAANACRSTAGGRPRGSRRAERQFVLAASTERVK